MDYTAEEDAMILDMVKSLRQPQWKKLAEQMQARGFDRTADGLICRYRLLPKPYEFKAVHKLMQTVMCNVRRKALSRIRGSVWQKDNKERCRDKAKRSRDLHKDELEYKKKHKERDARVRDKTYAREKRRLNEDIQFYTIKKMRSRMKCFIVRCKGTKKAAKTMELVACTPSELVERLSSLRDDVTIRDGHVDHIFPFAVYDVTSAEQQRAVCHHTNVQLLTAEENLEKSDKLPTRAMADGVMQCCWPPGVKYDDLPEIYDGWRSPLWK